ncbi:MAG: cytochrome C [Nitrospiraceae bacterium]|nr:MAG: cytochrome C [Nitrospiraceae bacterium]
MKKVFISVVAVTSVCLFFTIACSSDKPSKPEKATEVGGALFKQHCALCHPDGKNVIRKEKTLYRQDLEVNGIETPEDIIKVLRNPGPGMRKFDENTMSDEDAREIAVYVLDTFK